MCMSRAHDNHCNATARTHGLSMSLALKKGGWGGWGGSARDASSWGAGVALEG